MTAVPAAISTIATILFLLAGPGAPAAAPVPPPGPVRIGFLLPPDEPDRRALRRGAELALERRAGELPADRVPVELVVRGKPGQWGDDGDEAGRLALDDAVRVLIAPPGGAASHLALQVAGRTQVPVITLCPDTSVVGAGIPWALQLAPSSVAEARALFQDRRTWLVYTSGGREGREAREDLARAAREAGVTVVSRLWDPGPARPPVPPEVSGILVWLPLPVAVDAARALREGGWTGLLGGPGALRTAAFLRGTGPAALGFRVVAIEPGPESAVLLRSFADAYAARFGEPVEPAALLAADAVGLAEELLRRAGEGPPARLFPVAGGALGRGLTGAWEFDRRGNRVVTLRVLVWKGNAWVPLE
jgi:ABC-type branched-subunit amino acid transport system substrate-binding protein